MRTVTVRVRNHERGLLFRDNEFQRMLDPGVYRLWRNLLRAKRSHVELVTPLKPRLEHALLDVLLADPRVREATLEVNLAETQRALVWVDGRLIIDNYTVHPPVENQGTVRLDAGRRYDIRIDYFEQSGGAVMKLFWESPSQGRTVVPRERLYPAR